jgi:MutS2 family protein
MNEGALGTLELDKILEILAGFALSGLGKKMAEGLRPMTDVTAVNHALQETSEARLILDRGGHPPLLSLADIAETVEKVGRGAILPPPELMQIADLLRGSARMRRYMEDKSELAPLLSSYRYSITGLPELEEMIVQSIEGGIVSSSASTRLRTVRNRIRTVESRIQEKLNSLISSPSNQNYLQESYVTVKDGRFVLPIKAQFKHKIDGLVVGASGSGSTVFLEPAAVRKLANELQVLKSEEEAECYQILAMLSGMVSEQLTALKLNVETMAAYDFAFAKGRYSKSLDAEEPLLNTRRRISLRNARHPLLDRKAVPLNFEIGKDFRTLLITGPNTGGKTVALKTIGLLTLMAQAGLHIPAERDSEIAMCTEVWVDIGDGQSIEQSLSTFSSHMSNIAGILKEAGRGSLVLLDEIGTGTDPAEGAALGAAILGDLYASGALTVATTHYGDLKRFSEAHPGFENGMMEFDPETLSPLYRLVIGKAGVSNGIWIAERLGVKPETINKARSYLSDREHLGLLNLTRPAAEKLADETKSTVEDPVAPITAPAAKARPLQLGDRVFVHTVKQSGVVAELPDAKGMMTVMCRRRPVRVNHKRVTLERVREELYPDHENYDLNIVIMSKEDRRLVDSMNKKYTPGIRRTVKEGE